MAARVRANRKPLDLTRRQLDELNEFYRDTDVSTRELKYHFGLSKPVHHYITPLATGKECPNRSAVQVYYSRSARERGEKECRASGHAGRGDGWSYCCTCDYCSAARAEEERRRSEEALQRV